MSIIKIAFTTLGCKVNQDETIGMQTLFESAGCKVVDFKGKADVYIVNTCTVTHLASRKSRQLLRQARRRNPDAMVVAVGCYPQVNGTELGEMEEVSLIVGNSHKAEIVSIVLSALNGSGKRVTVGELDDFQDLPVSILTNRHRANLKIQDGCQRYCTYCIVPMARGKLRSMPPTTIIAQAEELVRAGFNEIILTGINLTSYGREANGNGSLASVIQALAPRVREARIRISSVEPTDFTPELAQAFRDHANVCRDFHIPLQSGSNTVLQRMGRKYSAHEFLALTERLRAQFELPSFSTDVIVGFPGETDAEFQETMDLVRKVGFSRLHVFRYSPRPGTLAATFKDQIPAKDAARRSRELINLGAELAAQFADSLLGAQEELLLEEPSNLLEGFVGYGERYMRIHCPSQGQPGNLVKVRITGNAGAELLARMV